MSHKNLSTVIAGILLAAILGCGQSSNPLKEYPELSSGSLVPPHDTTRQDQKYLGDVFTIDTDPPGSNVLNFTAGQAGSYRLLAQPLVEGVVYSLSLNNSAGQNVRLDRVGNSNAWNLSFTPDINAVPAGEFRPLTFTVDVLLSLSASSSMLAKKAFDGRSKKVSTFTISVNKSGDSPKIKRVTGNEKPLQLGDVGELKLLVEAPSVTSADQLAISSYYDAADRTGETLRFDGSTATSIKSVQPLDRKGNYQVSLNFDTNKARVAASQFQRGSDVTDKSSSLSVFQSIFHINVRNTYNNTSADSLVVFQVGQPGELQLKGNGSTNLIVGKSSVYFLGVRVSNSAGQTQVKVDEVNSAIANWPGKPVFACEDVSVGKKDDKKIEPSQKDCKLTWDVPCDADSKQDYKLSVQIENSDTIPKTKTFEQTFKLSGQCKATKKQASNVAAKKSDTQGLKNNGVQK